MSMTTASSEYFEKVAGQWDDLRAGYFGEGIRSAAIRKAYLRSEYVVADVGAGSGFMTAGIAPLVSRVNVMDGSAAMLEKARENLAGFDNLTFYEADGSALPLPDASQDAVFANMYLHHCADPLAAIREMRRVLRPGGRLVITDMDAHPYEWLKDEMADVWQGFEREQVYDWYRQTGLVNIILDSTGEDCCAKSEQPEEVAPDQRQVEISTFMAVGTRPVSGVTEAVQAGYGATARSGSSCCPALADQSSSCCSPSSAEQLIPLDVIQQSPQYMLDYRADELAEAPKEAVDISLGCGNPLAFASLQPGEMVVDIGSGGGIDAFLAARKVGPDGHVIGVDMTPEMLERARQTAQKAGFSQVEFRQGQAAALPVESGTADLVISNCVINLTEDKGRVFAEAYRVLSNGGRLEVSDVVTSQAFPREQAVDVENWAGCVYGALPEQEYLDLIEGAGFKDVRVHRSPGVELVSGVAVYSAIVSARK